MKEPRAQNRTSTSAKEPLRLLALSDGLFATVLTLLVLDLRIPDAIRASDGSLSALARWVGPHLFSYLMTFFVAGNYWLAHHRDFDRIKGYDRGLLAYNLLFLLFVGLFPFTTATISQGSSVLTDYPTYWAMYAGNFILAGIMLMLTRLYAESHGLLQPGASRRERQHILARQIVTPAVFLASVGAEYLFPWVLLGPWILLALLPIQLMIDRIFASSEPIGPSTLAAWPRRLWQAGITLLWILIFGFAVWVLTR